MADIDKYFDGIDNTPLDAETAEDGHEVAPGGTLDGDDDIVLLEGGAANLPGLQLTNLVEATKTAPSKLTSFYEV